MVEHGEQECQAQLNSCETVRAPFKTYPGESSQFELARAHPAHPQTQVHAMRTMAVTKPSSGIDNPLAEYGIVASSPPGMEGFTGTPVKLAVVPGSPP